MTLNKIINQDIMPYIRKKLYDMNNAQQLIYLDALERELEKYRTKLRRDYSTWKVSEK